MTNEELVALIREGNDTYITELWEQLQGFTNQQTYRFYIKYQSYCISAGVTPDDLLQEAFIALMMTIKAYDPDKGKVITYYGTAIKSRFLRLSGADTVNPLNVCTSLDIPLDADDTGSDTLGDTVPSPDDGISEVIENDYSDSLRRDINRVLKSLTPTGENIICQRFWSGKSLSEISTTHSIDIREIRREYEASMQRLRCRQNLNILRKYRDDIISRHAYRGSFSSWRDTGISSTERAVFKLMECVDRVPDVES